MSIIVQEDAPAKLNLALHVTGQRQDGLHLLDMMVIFTNIGDQIECRLADQDTFQVDGPMARGVPLDDSNIVLKARNYLRALYHDYACPPVAIKLSKHLPSASGIGGGSADAAATLRALITLWALPKDRIVLHDLAAHIGADVPMCYMSQPLIARGIGADIEVIEDALPEIPLVLINCGVAVSTPEIFKALRHKDNPALRVLPNPMTRATLTDYLSETRNDLTMPALLLCPDIQKGLHALEAAGAIFSRMSGSGATCYGMFESLDAAHKAANIIQADHADWWVMAAQSIAAKERAHYAD